MSELTRKEKEELFRKTIASERERAAYARTWAQLILEKLPAEVNVRNIFTVDELPDRAVPVYTIDLPYINAWVLPKMGSHPINLVTTEEVTIPTFEITGNVEYKEQFARDGRFNVAERAQQRLMDSIVDQEEEAGWAVLKAASQATNQVDASDLYGTGEAGITKKILNAVFVKFEERRGYKCTAVYASAKGLASIRDWEATKIDPTTQREIFVGAGLEGLWGATLNVSHRLGEDECFAFDTRPGLLGFMPIRENLRTFDDPTAIKKFRVGVIAYEEVGFGVLDSDRIVEVINISF